jgi:hypothetical protein
MEIVSTSFGTNSKHGIGQSSGIVCYPVLLNAQKSVLESYAWKLQVGNDTTV